MKQPIMQTRQSEPYRRDGTELGQGSVLGRAERTNRFIAGSKGRNRGGEGYPLGVKTPGRKGYREVVSEYVRTGELEVDQAAWRSAVEQDVVGKIVGMDRPDRQGPEGIEVAVLDPG